MPLQDADRALVASYFEAMATGRSGLEALIELFADDAVYVEPFGLLGQPRIHRGKAAIRATLQAGLERRPSDLVVEVNAIDIDEAGVFATWTCTAEALGGSVRGTDRYLLHAGRITRLETRLDGV